MPDIFQHQIDYYEARAPEYDDWFYRRGRYDWGNEKNLDWANEADEIRRFLHEFRGFNATLELAAGTGIWTTELLRISQRVDCLDASPAMIEINRRKQNTARVSFHQTDLFTWQPTNRYDLVSTCFWLSHIPSPKIVPFLQKVAASLGPDGLVFFVDSRLARASRAKDHEAPEIDTGISHRKLGNGREYEIVKVFHDPDALTAQFANAGLKATVKTTTNYFLYGTATHC